MPLAPNDQDRRFELYHTVFRGARWRSRREAAGGDHEEKGRGVVRDRVSKEDEVGDDFGGTAFRALGHHGQVSLAKEFFRAAGEDWWIRRRGERLGAR